MKNIIRDFLRKETDFNELELTKACYKYKNMEKFHLCVTNIDLKDLTYDDVCDFFFEEFKIVPLSIK